MQAKLLLDREKLGLVPGILKNYEDYLISVLADFVYNKPTDKERDNLYYQLSILEKLIIQFRKKNIDPPLISTVRFSLHEMMLMYNAFKFHELNIKDTELRRIARNLSAELDKQKPSTIQYLTQKHNQSTWTQF